VPKDGVPLARPSFCSVGSWEEGDVLVPVGKLQALTAVSTVLDHACWIMPHWPGGLLLWKGWFCQWEREGWHGEEKRSWENEVTRRPMIAQGTRRELQGDKARSRRKDVANDCARNASRIARWGEVE
jgi:hypothetical protein